MNKKTRLLIRATMVAIIPVLIVVGVALAASSITLGGFTIDFLGVEPLPPGPADTQVWTYAITEPVISPEEKVTGLSHWTLATGNCGYTVTVPANGSTFHTLTDKSWGCGTTYLNCVATTYEVEIGKDPTSPIPSGYDSLKFSDAGNQLEGALPPDIPATHIFQFSTKTEDGYFEIGDIFIWLKYGSGGDSNAIDGPGCGGTAVQLVSFEDAKRSRSLIQGTLIVMLGVLILGSGNLVLRRRRN